MPKVSFLNEALTVDAEKGQSIKEVAEAAGVNLFEGFWAEYHDRWMPLRCSGRGICFGAGCRVWVVKGDVSDRTLKEKIRPTHRGAIRLACQAKVLGDVEVRTQPGALEYQQNTQWDPDASPSRWKDRLTPKGGAADADEDDE
jgi:ferredoxin